MRLRARHVRRPGTFVVIGLLLGAVLAVATSWAAEPDEEDDEDGESFLDRAGLGVEADLEYAREGQGGETVSEFTFDEVGLSLDRDWWQAELGVKYESEGRGLIVEDFSLRLGGTGDLPWFALAGRTVPPFGVFESWFVEDPLVVVTGEIDDDFVILGRATERLEVAAGAFRGELADEGDVDLVASARFRGSRFGAGVSWASDLGESVELREFQQEQIDAARAAGGGPSNTTGHAVHGFALFASMELDRVLAVLEYVEASELFAAGTLADDELEPSAWNLEVAVRPGESWLIAVRAEGSSELPGIPERQAGVAASWSFSEKISLGADYLHAAFDGAEPDRDLVSAKLGLEF